MTVLLALFASLTLASANEPSEEEPALPTVPSSEPRAPMGATACSVSLFVYESDPKGLVIYAQPERGAAEVGRYPVDTMVQVIGVKGPWAQVAPVATDAELAAGWVGIELLTTNLRTPEEYGPQTAPTYRNKPASSESASKVALPIQSLTVKACQGDWLEAEWTDGKGKTVTGWLEPKAHCPQPNTTCS